MGFSRADAKEIFLDALELPQDERIAFVARSTEGDEELGARITALLVAHRESEKVLARSGSWVPELPSRLHADQLERGQFVDDQCKPGQRIGQFSLVETIGEGGFGRVWKAAQHSPVQREVALKVLKSGIEGDQVVRRFAAERQALALMDHPCIARVIDGGETDQGQPWFAMDLVLGPPITEYCIDQNLGVRGRLELFLQVCQAVQHAHQKGVVHRDIKPSNVLIATVGGKPMPKVIDFGISKAIGSGLGANTLQTLDGQVLGTPAYMSPEQLGDSVDVDTRADVYSLGVLLYELLSGTTPLEDTTASDAGILALLDVIRTVDPPRPSTRITNATAGKSSGLVGVIRAREVQGDLDWIVLRCLEKDRDQRYDSVAVLAMEVERHLAGEPVLAGPPTLRYRFSKFARKHSRALSFATVLLIALVGGLLVALAQARRAQDAEVQLLQEAERTRIELERFTAVAQFLEHILLGIDPAIAQGKDTELLESLLAVAGESLAGGEGRSPAVEATLRRIIGGSYRSLGLLDEAEEQLRRAFDVRRGEFGERALETLLSSEELGSMYMEAGALDQAQEYLELTLNGRRELLGAEHESTMHALSSLATLRKEQGDGARAEEMFETLEAWYTDHKGERDETTLMIVNNRAGVLEDMGRHEEALALYLMLVDAQVQEAGEQHPRTLAALNNLGSAYLGIGRLRDALDPLERALEIKRVILPEGHPSLLPTLGNLAYLHRQMGALDRALTILDEALEIAATSLDPMATRALQLRMTRASIWLDQGEYGLVCDDMQPIVDASVSALPEGDMLRVLAHGNMTRGLMGLGLAEDAEPHGRYGSRFVDDAFPVGHPARAATRLDWGHALMELGRLEEARDAFVAGYDQVKGTPNNDQLVGCLSALVEVHERLEQPLEADRWRKLGGY